MKARQNRTQTKIYSKSIIRVSNTKFLQDSQQKFAEASVFQEDGQQTKDCMRQTVKQGVKQEAKQHQKLHIQVKTTQFKLNLKRFLSQVLDEQTMNLIDNYLESDKFNQGQPKYHKNYSLIEDLQLFKFLKWNQQSLQMQGIRKLLNSFKTSSNITRRHSYCYDRMRRISQKTTKKGIINCISQNKKIQTDYCQKSDKQFLQQIWDQKVQIMIKQYINKHQNKQNQKNRKTLLKNHFSFLEDCQILLTMKQYAQKSEKQRLEIILNLIKTRSSLAIRQRIINLKGLLTKDLLIYSITNKFRIFKRLKMFQLGPIQFAKQINSIINLIILKQIQQNQNLQNSSLKQIGQNKITNIDNLIICLYLRKYFGQISLKSIYSIVASKIKKTQSQIQSRLKRLKIKYFNVSTTKTTKSENNQTIKNRQPNQLKTYKNSHESQNIVKIQENCPNINDQTPSPQQIKSKICHFFDQIDLNQIDEIVDKLNESKLQKCSIINTLKSLQIQKVFQSSFRKDDQQLSYKEQQKSQQQSQLQQNPDPSSDLQFFQHLKGSNGKNIKERIVQLLMSNNSQNRYFYCFYKTNRVLLKIKQEHIIKRFHQDKQIKSRKIQKSVKEFFGQIWCQNVQKIVKEYIQQSQINQNINKTFMSNINLLQDCKILVVAEENMQKSIQEISQMAAKNNLKRSTKIIQQRIRYLINYLNKDTLMFSIKNNCRISNLGTPCQFDTSRFVQHINVIINTILLEQKNAKESGNYKLRFTKFSFIDDLIFCFYIKNYFGQFPLKNIYRMIANKIGRTQQHIQNRLRTLKNKYFKIQPENQTNCKEVKETQTKKEVKLQFNSKAKFIGDDETTYLQIVQNERTENFIHKINSINSIQIDLIIDKLNESRFQQIPIIQILKQLLNPKQNESFYKLNYQENPSGQQKYNTEMVKMQEEISKKDKKDKKNAKKAQKKSKQKHQTSKWQIEVTTGKNLRKYTINQGNGELKIQFQWDWLKSVYNY